MMGKNFLQKVSECNLTRAQLQIATYIAKNQKRILNMTALEIGREIGVSDATVIRFTRAVGYDGFSDMKNHIQAELKQNSEKIGKHSLYDRFTMQTERYQETDSSSNEMLQLMETNLETSLRQNEEVLYNRISEHILHARKKVVIGLRGGKGCAIQFARLLGHITNNVDRIISEGNDDICQLAELGEEDVVVFLNFPRYYAIDEKIAKIISDQKIPCYLITDSMASPVSKYAKEILLVETEHCGFFHSMIGVMGVLEYLLILMCRKDPITFREKLKDRDDVLNEYRI